MKLGLCGPTWISLPKLRRRLTMKAVARNLEAEDSLHLDPEVDFVSHNALTQITSRYLLKLICVEETSKRILFLLKTQDTVFRII